MKSELNVENGTNYYHIEISKMQLINLMSKEDCRGSFLDLSSGYR